ncbi:hypothetical protein LZ578_05130 [Jeotgalibaca sp. MA1X17-3]|uniref:hypothetical protein n=1 Tax=Jeotgalibaca sp. MA1X17-3 TaxID=2908211 RepID=UPI001F1EB432|nr:hypothetical protein [Jeotgalibaca sp. MA1X17-3]UJF16489.1 hypothetical protein LZ578_05130 [Jeotgalibaca sp. MA1X17-3]
MIKGWKNILISYGVPLIGMLIYWYFALTPLTFQSMEFWMNLIVYLVVSATLSNLLDIRNGKRVIQINGALIAISLVTILVGMALGTQVFRSESYSKLITHEDGQFDKDLTSTNPSEIPTIDRSMAERLGSRKIGEVLDLVSQFRVSDEYTQIAYKGDSVRVSPLEYVNFFRWFSNRGDGIPYYVMVDMVSGDADLINLEETLRYSHSGFFGDDIKRHIFMHHPTTLFEKPVFELDEEGDPFYVAPIVKRQFSFLGPKDVVGIFVVDAQSGEITRYGLDEVPDWVDRVYPANLVMEQINYNGMYQNGFLNSIITKRNVIQNAGGYNYIVLDNDLYLYTGLTSVTSDESNIGFLLVNSRTKESRRYNISTATEWSVMESAEGSVQEKEYNSTFPLLFNMNNKPVFQLSLKDEAGLIKLYAFVDALNYQRVGIGSSLERAWTDYNGGVATIPDEDLTDEEIEEIPMETVTGEITLIEAVVVAGETTYYFTLNDDNEVIYIAPVSLNNELPFLKAGEKVSIEVQNNLVRSIIKE